MSSREVLDDGGASASPPPLGTRKGGEFVALKGTPVAPTAACPYVEEIGLDEEEKNVRQVEVEAKEAWQGVHVDRARE